MTRKDYEKIAAAIKEASSSCNGFNSADAEVVADLVLSMSRIFAQDNPRFDRARFLKACGIESE